MKTRRWRLDLRSLVVGYSYFGFLAQPMPSWKPSPCHRLQERPWKPASDGFCNLQTLGRSNGFKKYFAGPSVSADIAQNPWMGKSKTAWLWTYARDDRPFGGDDPGAHRGVGGDDSLESY